MPDGQRSHRRSASRASHRQEGEGDTGVMVSTTVSPAPPSRPTSFDMRQLRVGSTSDGKVPSYSQQ